MVSLRKLLYNGRKPFKEDIFMDNKQKNLSDAAAMAQFRLALIAPVIHGLYPDASRNAYYQRITENPLTLPDGSAFRYSPKTISKWVSLYQNGGIDALMPRERSDKGGTRVLTDTAIEEIYRLKEAFPRLNSTQIHRHLVEEAFIPASVSVCAVQRFVKKHDLKSARNPNMRDRKAFEEDAFGKMWQADTCYLPYITEDGLRRRVYCILIIDDHSRFLVGGGLFYNDSAYNFQKVLKDAVAAHGIPSKLYVDNGSSYSNGQLSLICGSIGTVLLHTKIRDGASKAKIERQFRTLKETWLYTLDLDSLSSLAQFNIYPSSSTKTILSGNLQSPIGFLVYLNYEWHPYSDISTNPDHNYPFVCRLYDGNNSYNDIILTELGTGNLEWTQSFSWSETSFSRMDFVADDYDVYVTVPKAIIANF